MAVTGDDDKARPPIPKQASLAAQKAALSGVVASVTSRQVAQHNCARVEHCAHVARCGAHLPMVSDRWPAHMSRSFGAAVVFLSPIMVLARPVAAFAARVALEMRHCVESQHQVLDICCSVQKVCQAEARHIGLHFMAYHANTSACVRVLVTHNRHSR